MSPINNTAMKIGNRCEPLIANKVSNFVKERGIKLSDMVEVGLVKMNISKYIATSVDRLCVISLYDPTIHGEINKDGDGSILGNLEKVVGIEIKCMTNKKTRDIALQSTTYCKV